LEELLNNIDIFGGRMLELKDTIKRAFEYFEKIYEGEKLPGIL